MSLSASRSNPADSAACAGELHSTQVHPWPRGLRLWVTYGPQVSLMVACCGLFLVLSSRTAGDIPRMSVGLLLVVTAVFVTLGSLIPHLVVAREVRFTRDRIIVRQTGRRDLVLPFVTYEKEWVADLHGRGSIRLLFFEQNRGAIILSPPTWLRDALVEIARIQAEEGWYEPEANEPIAIPEKLTPRA